METICLVIIGLLLYDLLKWKVKAIFTPKNRKSFKEGYQPIDKLDTSNPPGRKSFQERIAEKQQGQVNNEIRLGDEVVWIELDKRSVWLDNECYINSKDILTATEPQLK